MAPLTRSRATTDGMPTSMMADYYAQRASAGLIIAEGTNVSPQARGYACTPNLYDPAHADAWQPVTRAVHARGGRIFVQLWHVGRISHPSLQPGGILPVAPSAITPSATAFTPTGFRACVKPRALKLDEMPQLVAAYREAARNALRAGFDGIEIHAANGYLLEQFLRDGSNLRDDKYGGSIQNRIRLLMEITEACATVVGPDRVGVRLSPASTVNDSALDSDPEALYGHVAEGLNGLQVLYIHVIEGMTQGPREVAGGFDPQILRRIFTGCYIANNGYDRELAIAARRENRAELIAFGRAFIANPDLVERLRSNAPLNVPDRSTFFGGGARGYTDYPRLANRKLDMVERALI